MGRDHTDDLGVDWIMLKCVLGKYGLACILNSSALRNRKLVGPCEHGT
jgi:hypothetical protein